MTALEMNPEIRARWTAALRSGAYPQGANALRRDGHWCCLGVLCDLAEQDGITQALDEDGEPGDGGEGAYSYDGRPDLLPTSVCEWAGLDHSGPLVTIQDFGGPGLTDRIELTALNDYERWDFTRIADAIDGAPPQKGK